MVTCKYCNYETPHKQILTRHIKTKHQDQPFEKEEYKCNNCQKTFTSNASCKRHETQKVCYKNKSDQLSVITLPPPIKIPEIVAESDFEETPVKQCKNIKIEQPSAIQCILDLPIVRWAKYIGCTLLVIHLIRPKSKL